MNTTVAVIVVAAAVAAVIIAGIIIKKAQALRALNGRGAEHDFAPHPLQERRLYNMPTIVLKNAGLKYAIRAQSAENSRACFVKIADGRGA